MRSSALAPVSCALLAALLGASPAPATDAPTTTAPAIEFVMPAAGAFIPAGPVMVAGRLPPGADAVTLAFDGAPVADIARDGRAFSVLLAPGPGQHVIVARSGALTAKLSFSYGSGGGGAQPYRFHAPVLERRCAECHDGVRTGKPAAEAETCRSCHRKMAMIYPYVHGPLAAGKCTVCHEPHGSRWPALAVSDARTMCTSCHDQPGSLAHVEKARSRVCHLCHNPHASMNRKFLYDIVK
jgi:predicted CXXCH cytochrome family protein